MKGKIAKGIVATGTTDECRVYVACLACYNEGKLRGEIMTADELETMSEWLPSLVDDDGNQVLCGVRHHHEYAIHDYDGDISRIGGHLGEHPDIEDLIEIMNFCDTTTDAIPVAMLCIERNGNIPSFSDLEYVYDNMEQMDDLKDWAYETCKDCGYFEEPTGWSPISYIDWARVAEDMLMDYISIEYGHTTYMMRD
jgi:antirestriction protein